MKLHRGFPNLPSNVPEIFEISKWFLSVSRGAGSMFWVSDYAESRYLQCCNWSYRLKMLSKRVMTKRKKKVFKTLAALNFFFVMRSARPFLSWPYQMIEDKNLNKLRGAFVLILCGNKVTTILVWNEKWRNFQKRVAG